MNVENISRFKKDRFLRGLSEDDFRDRVIRPLMLRLGYGDGRDLCGPMEHGKDTVFSLQSPIGTTEFTAVQTKKGNLNLASGAERNLVAAITQLRTALATPIIVLANKQKVRPNKVILCASGRINDAAREHVLDEVKESNVQFLDSDDLLPLLDKNLPEFWLGLDVDILPYFRAVLSSFADSANAESNLAHDGALASAVQDDGFVGLHLYRTVIKKRTVRGKIEEKPEFQELPFVSVLSGKSTRILILGDAGSGKSTGLKRLTLEIARKSVASDGSYQIPILLKAPELVRNRVVDLVQYCDEQTRSIAGTKNACFTLDDLTKGNVVLLLDALDEIGERVDKALVLSAFAAFHVRFPKCRQVITARPYKSITEMPELVGVDEYRIAPISWKQAEKIVTRVTKNKKIPVAASREVLRNLEHIHGIELNPLLVTVFAATADMNKQDIPANITELFKKFTELMLGRWDERKGFHLQYQAPLKDFVLTKIGYFIHVNKKTSILRSEAEDIARSELRARGHDDDASALLTEVFERSGLFRVTGDEIEFRHHLLQEFFAGRGIDSPEAVNVLIVDEWWKRAIVFYFGEHPERIDLLEGCMKGLAGVDHSRLFEAATAVGLALQACYLSPVAAKLQVWKWVVRALGVTQDPFLKRPGLLEKYPTMSLITFYLYARDSVALFNLKQNRELLAAWASAGDLELDDFSERSMFWLIVGLSESGEIGEAELLLQQYRPKDMRLLVAIHLGCHLASEVRPLSQQQKRAAKAICARLAEKILPFRKALVKEYGSILLELRQGKIAAIEESTEGTLDSA